MLPLFKRLAAWWPSLAPAPRWTLKWWDLENLSCVRVLTCARSKMHIHVCLPACSLRLRACLPAWLSVCSSVYLFTYVITYKHTCMDTCTCTYVHIYIHAYIRYIHQYIHPYIHLLTRTRTYTYTCTDAQTYTNQKLRCIVIHRFKSADTS